jgi:hypothetical protein
MRGVRCYEYAALPHACDATIVKAILVGNLDGIFARLRSTGKQATKRFGLASEILFIGEVGAIIAVCDAPETVLAAVGE